MFRNVSTHMLPMRRTSQLSDRRARPTITPRIVAENAGNGQTQGVDHGGPEGPSTRVGVGVDSLTDLNVDGAFKEVEVGVDVPCPKVVPGLIGQEPHGAEYHEQQEDLCHPLEDDDVAPQWHSLGYPLSGGDIGHR